MNTNANPDKMVTIKLELQTSVLKEIKELSEKVGISYQDLIRVFLYQMLTREQSLCK